MPCSACSISNITSTKCEERQERRRQGKVMIYSNKLNKRFCYWRRGSFSLGLAWLGQFARCSFWLPFNLFFSAGHIACLWLHFIVSFSRSRLNQCGALPSPIAIVFSSISISATGFVYLLHLPFGPASSPSPSSSSSFFLSVLGLLFLSLPFSLCLFVLCSAALHHFFIRAQHPVPS